MQAKTCYGKRKGGEPAKRKVEQMRFLKLGAVILVTMTLTACASVNGGAGSGADITKLDPSSVAYFNVTIGDRVLFGVNENNLSAESTAILDAQANWLLANTQYSVTVEGHADERGTREYNLALGARRASAVQNYLVSKGVSDSRINTVTYGKERPIETCSSEPCWTKNRRAVTVVAGGFSS
jgi:peptidoglycan-associated lipoprotein